MVFFSQHRDSCHRIPFFCFFSILLFFSNPFIANTEVLSSPEEFSVQENIVTTFEETSETEPLVETSETEPLVETSEAGLNAKDSEEVKSSFIQKEFQDTKTEITFDKYSLFIFSGILITLLLLLLIVTYLLAREVRWRRRFSKRESVVFPDAHLDFLEKLNIYFAELANSVQDSQNRSLIFQKENNSLSEKIMDSVSKFNEVIGNQKIEIDRLKEGYDFSIRKKTIMSLIETKELIYKFLYEESNLDSKERLNKVVKYIESYLEEFDVEEFFIDEGKFFRDLSGEDFEIVGTENTNDETLDGKVFKTTDSGYAFIHENGKTIIKKANILVYKKEA